MLTKVIKRDGRIVSFKEDKIKDAILGAMKDANLLDYQLLEIVTKEVIKDLQITFSNSRHYPSVEQVQDSVMRILQRHSKTTYNTFKSYRKERTKKRIKSMAFIKKIENIFDEAERDNANIGNSPSGKMLQIGSTISKYVNSLSMPEIIAEAHADGDIHIHDEDYHKLTINCLHIDTGTVLERGFDTGYGTINRPKRYYTAAELSCILLQSAQNDMYGGVRLVAL